MLDIYFIIELGLDYWAFSLCAIFYALTLSAIVISVFCSIVEPALSLEVYGFSCFFEHYLISDLPVAEDPIIALEPSAREDVSFLFLLP